MQYTAPISWRLSQKTYNLPEGYSKTGRIISFSQVDQSDTLFKSFAPYIIAVVELDSGQRISTQIVDCDINSVKIGMEVKTVFRKLFAENTKSIVNYGIKFRPTEDAQSGSSNR